MKRGRPRSEVRKVFITTSVDPTLAEKLSIIAKKDHRSTSGQISKILEDWISKEEGNGGTK